MQSYRFFYLILYLILPIYATYLIYINLINYLNSLSVLVWFISAIATFLVTIKLVILKDYGVGVILITVSSIMLYIAIYLTFI